MQTLDAWSLLTEDEQEITKSKLQIEAGETCQQAFNRITGVGDASEIENKVTLIRNFIDHAGGRSNSAIWQQALVIEGVWLGQDHDAQRNDPRFHEGGGVVIVVSNKDEFLDTLRNNGYTVNAWYEKGGWHPNDSAREITDTSWETAMHLTNDDSSNLNRFFVHWDKRSTEFRIADSRYWTRWGEQREAGKSHCEPFPASEVREQLKRRGIVSEERSEGQ